jgi:hypothetical protein
MQQNSSSSTTRIGLVAGAVVGPLFVISDLVNALTRPGYQPLRHWVSHLSLGPLGWIGVATLVITAALLAGYALAVFRVGERRWRAYPAAVAVAAVALVIAAIFPMDPSLGFPAGASADGVPTVAGQVHQIAGPLFIVALAVAAFTSGRVLRALGVRRARSRWGSTVGTAVIVAFIVCSTLVSLDYAGVIPHAWSGLFERIAIDAGLLWVSTVAAVAIRAPRPTVSTVRG